jgi:hypothetical protein
MLLNRLKENVTYKESRKNWGRGEEIKKQIKDRRKGTEYLKCVRLPAYSYLSTRC